MKLSSNWTPSYQTSLVPYQRWFPPVNVSTVHVCKWSTSTETSRSLMATTVSEILISENLITHLGSEKRTEHIWRYGEALQTDQSFRELQALAVDPKRGPQRDPIVKSSSDCLTRWEKQDKKGQNGLDKSLDISICDSFAISIVTLNYLPLLSWLRPIEMRNSTSQAIR